MPMPLASATPARAPWPPLARDAAEWLAAEHGVRRGRRALRGALIGLLALVMAACGLVVLGAETSSTGVAGFLIGVSLAVLPLPIVIAALRWVDRYEPEPKALLVFAFFWGATVAALIAAVLNTASAIIVARTSDAGQGMATAAVLVAPWVEEAAKGAAVLAIFLFRRKEFDGIVDGIVLAGFTGVGFAFTENILYFGRAFLAGNEQQGLTGGLFAAGATFALRGVLAPFAHPLFTTMTGIGLGIAARGRPGRGALAGPIGGYLLAVALHATWNYSSLSGLRGFFTGYVLIMVPVFLLTLGVATWSRRREGATSCRVAADLRAGGVARGRGRGDDRVDATATAGGGVGGTDVRRRQLTRVARLPARGDRACLPAQPGRAGSSPGRLRGPGTPAARRAQPQPRGGAQPGASLIAVRLAVVPSRSC